MVNNPNFKEDMLDRFNTDIWFPLEAAVEKIYSKIQLILVKLLKLKEKLLAAKVYFDRIGLLREVIKAWRKKTNKDASEVIEEVGDSLSETKPGNLEDKASIDSEKEEKNGK
jgi:hypothetical protein